MSAVTATGVPTPAHAPPAGRRGNPWLSLAAVAFGLFMVGLDGSVVSIANPEIGRDLRASTAQLQWVTNAYLLALAAALILGGKLGDRFGRRRYYLIGVAGFTVSSVAIGLAGSIDGVIAFRAAQGFFGALLMPNTLGILRAVFPPRRFGMAVGIWAMVSSVSTALGPIVGGLLVQHVSWESVFYLNAPVGVLALIVSALVLPESRNSTGRHRFDVAGVALLAAGLLVLVFGVVKGETWGWGSGRTLGTLLAGLLILVFFGWFETRLEHPLLPMRLFRSPALTIGALITAVNFFTLLGSIFYIMLYLQNVRGYSPVWAGVLTLPLSLASVVASPVGAALTDRFGPRFSMPLGMVLQGGASFGLMLLDTDSGYGAMWPSFIGLGLGVGMVMAASSEAIVGNAPVKDGGVAGGLQATMLQVGGALGTSVLISLISSRVGGTLVGSLTDAGVPAPLAQGLRAAQDAVAMGIAPVTPDMPGTVRAAVIEGAGAAFVAGVHTAALASGVLCLIGAVVSAVFIRRGARPGEIVLPAH
ncbi:MFS transporter [Actinoplanes teichomyceticus]|uniref:EmrB/QacA subfamily drug resistance transporter n=1 Tax=Actinoplanes teichomyceticus TaxID=1867 RepID=A0A561WA28_ACTTI|nr:MFS transporter [Actinoplanes teichomyceticus]TWG20717.1 EmrB/QacA subfamily drug resistance transporter [Actinoplanes teichomyceticus]GIF14373.1 MFS transporter [Actinoplanes teichomyceticus]